MKPAIIKGNNLAASVGHAGLLATDIFTFKQLNYDQTKLAEFLGLLQHIVSRHDGIVLFILYSHMLASLAL